MVTGLLRSLCIALKQVLAPKIKTAKFLGSKSANEPIQWVKL